MEAALDDIAVTLAAMVLTSDNYRSFDGGDQHIDDSYSGSIVVGDGTLAIIDVDLAVIAVTLVEIVVSPMEMNVDLAANDCHIFGNGGCSFSGICHGFGKNK